MEYSILVVDDQQIIRDMLENTLSRESYTVYCAGSAEEALKILSQESIDVVISDEVMPGMTGTQFLAVVRKAYPDVIRIILTGHASLESAMRAINEGEIYRFLTKPCNLVDLSVTIRQALQQKYLKNENKRLAKIVKQQSYSLGEIEEKYPGITKVKRDSGGAIIIDDND
ncbi:MAG: response regulator [Thermodesulfobacteriota bacterium]|nr:response regulator [Thermodesulfobacteriota bacterium]